MSGNVDGVPSVSGVNQWDALSGAVQSVRNATLTVEGVVVQGRWKWFSPGKYSKAQWFLPMYPKDPATGNDTLVCGGLGCLYDVQDDPGERNEVSASNPGLCASMRYLNGNMTEKWDGWVPLTVNITQAQ
eukprot:gene5693-5640_t